MIQKSETILLSIIIPVFNAEKFLKEALDSLTSQSYKPIEIICVDDGSTDRSIDIIQSCIEKDHRIHLYYNDHKFAGTARNRGLKEAKGLYIHFLDADDMVTRFGYEIAMTKAIQKKLDCIKFSAIALDDITKKEYLTDYYNYASLSSDCFDKIVNDTALYTFQCVTPWSGIYLRDFLLRHDIFFSDLQCMNDRSFYQKMLMYADRLMFVKDKVVIHRTNVRESLVTKRFAHFDGYEKNISIVEEDLLHSNVPKKLYLNYLLPELTDMVNWYEKALVNKLGNKDITNIVLNLLIRYTIKYPSIYKLWFQIIKIWVKSLFQYKKEECKYPMVKQLDKESFISILINVKENEEILSTILDQLMNIQNPRFKFISYSGHMTKLSELIVQQFSEIDKRFFLIKSDRNNIINHIPDSLYIDYSANTKI